MGVADLFEPCWLGEAIGRRGKGYRGYREGSKLYGTAKLAGVREGIVVWAKWGPVLGLGLTAFGILIAFYLPGIGFNLPRQHSYYGSSDKSERKERWVRRGTVAGTILVIVGTLLQLYAAWPAAR